MNYPNGENQFIMTMAFFLAVYLTVLIVGVVNGYNGGMGL